jgi:hypothetical protein
MKMKKIPKKAVKKVGEKKHFVTFYSPGTFTSETRTVPIKSWDTKEAVRIAKGVKERHAATPYGFRFDTRLTVPPVRLGKHRLEVTPKTLKTSGMYFITGIVRTAASILKGTDPEEATLRSNVECNKIPAIVENNNSWKFTAPFERNDAVLDEEGNVLLKFSDLPKSA